MRADRSQVAWGALVISLHRWVAVSRVDGSLEARIALRLDK
jgi:hypothetical protein